MTTEMENGCQHREHKGQPACNKLCDPEQTLCPHHLLLAQLKKGKPPQKSAGTSHRTPRAYSE